MCKWGTDTEVTLISGKRVQVDSCIAPIVAGLQQAGVQTTGSCCGHGKSAGSILLADGRELTIGRPGRVIRVAIAALSRCSVAAMTTREQLRVARRAHKILARRFGTHRSD